SVNAPMLRMDCSALPALSERAHRARATALHRSFLACGEVANASNFDILAAPPVGLPAGAGEGAPRSSSAALAPRSPRADGKPLF
ncbi:MAG TPA: hypothetical protein VIF61_06355, partial [Methylocystis sp.]